MQLFRLSSFIVLIQISFTSQANSIGTPASPALESKGYILMLANEKSGLIISLPATSTNGLLEEMGEARANLQAHQTKLSRIAEDCEFNVSDGLITAIMPGGLLYAAVVQQRHHQAVERLNSVTARVDELTREIIEFQAAAFGQNLLAALN